jgi:hypothetical protein
MGEVVAPGMEKWTRRCGEKGSRRGWGKWAPGTGEVVMLGMGEVVAPGMGEVVALGTGEVAASATREVVTPERREVVAPASRCLGGQEGAGGGEFISSPPLILN